MKPMSAFRFFIALRLHPPSSLAILAAVTAVGVYIALTMPARQDDEAGIVLLVQMFLASSGFTESARRGHFDSLLTNADRTHVTMTHFVVSVLPGVFCWTILALTMMVMDREGAASMLYGARAAALLIVSSIAWVAGFALPRGTAGFLWTTALFVLLLRRPDAVSPATLPGVLFCPFVLLRSGPVDAAPIVAALVLTTTALLWIWRRARRLDIYLVERA